MEKLIELLNEYEKKIKKSVFDEWEKGIGGDTNLFRRDTRDAEGNHIYSDTADTYVISKKFGFIKWLVDNNKIDRLTFCTVETPSSKYEDFDLGPETPREDYTNILLMDLAIQDNPIEFLISILK